MVELANILILIISVLLSIAFFTLMERKVISFTQIRKGPNKTLLAGIVQPMADAIKLASKELNLGQKTNLNIYLASPMANLFCSLLLWVVVPFSPEFNFMKMSSVFMISCMSVNTLTIMSMSWSSNSNYALIGMMRTVSQLVSYEINFMMIMIMMINLLDQMNFKLMWILQRWLPMMIFASVGFILWMMTILAETNRTPFDFSEGESELVSGFNVEYGSSSFMLLFLSEYSSILVMSVSTVFMFTGWCPTLPMFYLSYFLTCFYFIWTRSTLPRFRYDKLMHTNWTQVLPWTTILLFVSFGAKMYCTI